MASTSVATVEFGDLITSDVTDASTVIQVTWKQMLSAKEEEYCKGSFQNSSKEGKSGIIFVQKSKLADFLKLQHESKIKIDEAFQYGQKDDTGANRWIVYHDKSNKPFQHRFVSAVGKVYSYGKPALEVLAKMGFVSGLNVEDFFKGVENWVGNHLHTFKAAK